MSPDRALKKRTVFFFLRMEEDHVMEKDVQFSNFKLLLQWAQEIYDD